VKITPKNWRDFQHYKDRNPPWIRLHKGLLDNFDFHRLPVASRALAPMLWLLASEYEGGAITASVDELAFRLRVTNAEVNDGLKPLIQAGVFIVEQDASTPLAERKQDACLEKRREEEEQREAIASSSADAAPALKAVPPACPQDRIRALYAEDLPGLPKAKLWGNDRQSALRSRWAEMVKLRSWTTADEGVEWFRRFFEAVSADDWLMGRSQRSTGHENWECSIDYLLSPKGFRKVVEGSGRDKAAA
jgi:hypothetical protein